MAVYLRRAILFMVLLIAVLQVIHLTLLSKLESKKVERIKRSKAALNEVLSENVHTPYQNNDLIEDRKRMWNLVKDSSILDSSGEYRIINHFSRAQSLGYRNHVRKDVTLVTQSSISRLHHLITVMQRWQGLVSVAVFTLTEDISSTIEAILLLRRCFPIIRYNASFHLISPLRVPVVVSGALSSISRPSDYSFSNVDCETATELIQALQPSNINYDHKGVPFPNNLLRNVGRHNAFTEFVFVTDIDLIPSYNLRQQFMEFAVTNRILDESMKEDKTVFVVPAYEVKEELSDESIPRDKSELLRLVDTLEARPFYFELCWKCHKYTDYDAWQRERQTPKLTVLFEVLWRDPWEPFYISRNNVPFYDERFRQYGFNRISQVCELHFSGFKFSVLNNAFVVHKGLKTANTFHKQKDLELEKNRLLFRQFKNELKDRYPDSSRRCY
ncbi:beta-1:4-glucuronyltransferase 1-like protein [Leptotrombidium deliense]|uniref:Beta-1,4-glucuronyltransferase 1 n=1 Tax=Leptotrombidium deliense TaxID=299467 RepID=A0A443SL48_9ACAR|nr:beta-1:4-glucuronyltransferase 1-like protein [Leptotrombidium deliense]